MLVPGRDNLSMCMAFQGIEQISAALKRSASPLICIASGSGIDGYAAGLGLHAVLKQLGKTPTLVAADGAAPPSLSFLPHTNDVQTHLERLRQFRIEIDARQTPVDGLKYELKDGKLLIHLEPRRGTWTNKDVKMMASAFRFDLIILLGAADVSACGSLYTEHPDFFAKVPVVNIDYRPENEQYAPLNLVDLTASSLGEVCYHLGHATDATCITPDIATAFLTGVIANTHGFRAHTVTPKHLDVAGKLLACGADRGCIVEHLYRTRSVNTLKLWGRVLSTLTHEADTGLTWSVLTRSDIIQSGASERDLSDVIDELIATSSQARVIALIYEGEDHAIHLLLHTERPHDALALTSTWHGTGTRHLSRAHITNTPLSSAQHTILQTLRSRLKTHSA